MIEYEIANKIRDLRLKQKMRIQELAERTGLSKSLISKIENNKVSAPIATLSKISDALGIHISYFFNQETVTSSAIVTRKNEGKSYKREFGHTRKVYEALAMELPNKKAEPYIITQSNIRSSDKPVEFDRHGGEEFVYVLEGQVEQTYGESTYILNKGDSIYFKGDIPHLTRSTKGQAKCLVVLIS